MIHTLRAWFGAALAAITSIPPRLRRRERVLTHDILSMQLAITAIIGTLAIVGLYGGGQWILQDNYSRWAMQWTEELNELGAPLYLPGDDDVQIRLKSFIEKYPEITRVTYYGEDGEVIHSLLNGQPASGLAASMVSEMMLELTKLVSTETPYLIEGGFANARAFEILAPVWTESIDRDGLFDFDPAASSNRMTVDLIGFVGVDLDFIPFHNRLLSDIKIAISILLAILIVSGFVGRRLLQRTLSAISDLHQPIAELAKGNLNVAFKPAEHREISEIVHALESTASLLGKRNARLVTLANQDVLTGLLNRRRLVDEIKREIDNVAGSKLSSALLFIDLDQFKYVNDTCGHPAGDRLIRKVADQLKSSVNDQGIVARFGGDEFAILAHGVNKQQAKNLAEKILEDMRRLAHVENNNVFHVHCSIGIAMIIDGKFDRDQIVAQADIACREAKAGGRDRFDFYSMSEQEAGKMAADVGWMSRLREAIDNDLFMLRYQPIVQISTGKVLYHEVLLRMQGNNGKTIAPEAFLPAAARFGLMAEIDTWLVEHAIAAVAKHQQKRPELRFAFNLSASAFERPDLADFVRATLDNHGVPPSSVIIEIAESVIVRHLSSVDTQIASLRKLGCEMALDDFAAGYSSLSCLQQLPMTYIKIDGSFIKDIVKNSVDQKMVRMIGEVGRESGMKTIAEYVQNGAAMSLLGKLGIDFAQGYYIGRPLVKPSTKSMPVTLSSKSRKRSARARA